MLPLEGKLGPNLYVLALIKSRNCIVCNLCFTSEGFLMSWPLTLSSFTFVFGCRFLGSCHGALKVLRTELLKIRYEEILLRRPNWINYVVELFAGQHNCELGVRGYYFTSFGCNNTNCCQCLFRQP